MVFKEIQGNNSNCHFKNETLKYNAVYMYTNSEGMMVGKYLKKTFVCYDKNIKNLLLL